MYSTNLRIPVELLERIKEAAKQNHRSNNSEILRAIEYYLDHAPEAQEKRKEPPKTEPGTG